MSIQPDLAVHMLHAIAASAGAPDARTRILRALAGLCEIVDGAFATACIATPRLGTNELEFSEQLVCGVWDDESRHARLDYLKGNHHFDPFFAAWVGRAATLPLAVESLVLARRELVPDEQWYATDYHREVCARIGCDDCVYAGLRARTRGGWVGTGVHRDAEQPPFSPSDVRTIELFLRGIRPFFDEFETAPGGSTSMMASLTRRQRELVLMAAEGLSAKQIANRMDLTEASVSTYFKRLYRRLGVSGRSELLAALHRAGVLSAELGTS